MKTASRVKPVTNQLHYSLKTDTCPACLVQNTTALPSLPCVVVSVFALHTKCCRISYNCSMYHMITNKFLYVNLNTIGNKPDIYFWRNWNNAQLFNWALRMKFNTLLIFLILIILDFTFGRPMENLRKKRQLNGTGVSGGKINKVQVNRLLTLIS